MNFYVSGSPQIYLFLINFLSRMSCHSYLKLEYYFTYLRWSSRASKKEFFKLFTPKEVNYLGSAG